MKVENMASRWRAPWRWGQRAEMKRATRWLDCVVQLARQPGLFGEGRTPDTVDGRLEMLFLHAALVLRRLGAEPGGRAASQAFTDLLFRHVDEGLREVGVGDLSVPKTMKRLAGRFYGRLNAYVAPLSAGDEAALEAAIARNVFDGGAQGAFSAQLAAYAAATDASLAQTPLDRLDDFAAWRSMPA